MMLVISFLLNIIYLGILVILSPWILYKMLCKGKYKDTLLERLGFLRHLPQIKECILVHGVSVGEIKSAKPLISLLKKEYPNIPLVISSTSSTGKATAKNLYPDCIVVSFPLDFSWAVASFFRHLAPKLIILMELELWPNFLLWAQKRKIPVMLVNGRLSEHSFRGFHRYLRYFFSRMTSSIRYFSVQAEVYKERFMKLGIPENRIFVTGNIKFDSVSPDEALAQAAVLSEKLGIKNEFQILVAGSTHPPEEEIIISSYKKVLDLFSNFRMIVVPRHPERADEIVSLIKRAGLNPVKKSTIQERFSFSADSIIIGDKMGELAYLYAVGSLSFIGGSLIPHGGQNFIEAASLGKSVVCGPYMNNFPDVQYFVEQNALIQLEKPEYLADTILTLLKNPQKMTTMGEKAKEIVQKGKGSTRKNLELCMTLLPTCSQAKS